MYSAQRWVQRSLGVRKIYFSAYYTKALPSNLNQESNDSEDSEWLFLYRL